MVSFSIGDCMTSSISPPVVYRCGHHNHLFSNYVCENQYLIRKVINIFFNVLTLGIPSLIYRIIACCFPQNRFGINYEIDRNKAVRSAQQSIPIKPYSLLGQEAIDFARKKIKEHPGIKPNLFSAGWNGSSTTHQPRNQEIALLTTLRWEIYQIKFKQALKNHPIDPWRCPEVIQAADDLMKIGYAISCLALDDLKTFTKYLENKEIYRTYPEALREQDSYFCQVFFYTPIIYRAARFGIAFKPAFEDGALAYPEEDVSRAHVNPFYQKGTIQNKWRALYNDYCERITYYVNKEDLNEADPRYVNWSQKDDNISFFGNSPFESRPDTLP